MEGPWEQQRPKGNEPRNQLVEIVGRNAPRQKQERADTGRTHTNVQDGGKSPDWTSGTVGDDVLTVHKVCDGKSDCGVTGKVDEWRRAINCPACLGTSVALQAPASVAPACESPMS